MNVYPNTDKKLQHLSQLFKRPLAAKHAMQSLRGVLETPLLADLILSATEENPQKDVRKEVMDYLRAELPEIVNRFMGETFDNVGGNISTLGTFPEIT